jgi:hypothetical protein
MDGGESSLSGDPALDEYHNKDSDARITEPKMLALKLPSLHFAVFETT